MTIMLDQEVVTPELDAASTLGETLLWVQNRLQDTGKVIVKVEIDGTVLDGTALSEKDQMAVGARQVGIFTADQRDLAHAMLGKLAALVEYLGTRHRDVANLIEQGQLPKALEQLGGVLSAWQQIDQAYSSLCRMLHLRVEDLHVGDKRATDSLAEFQGQLQEIHQALTQQDMVLLADVLQYEMDGAVANWTGMLAATLGVVDGVI